MDSVSNISVKTYDNKAQGQQTQSLKQKKEKKEKDLFTQTPLRKLGFLDEYGEALRPILSVSKNPIVANLPNMAYIPSTIYMMADVADKYNKGEDGTGKKPSVKMGVREACYQGIVSVAAPVAIIRGTHKFIKNVADSSFKTPEFISKHGKKAIDTLKKNKFAKNVILKAGMPTKLAGAAISILALSKLSKPVDWAVSKVFDKVVDPLIGINKKADKE